MFATRASPAALAVADINADGKPDAVTANSDGSISVLTGNGDGTFGAPATYPATASRSTPTAISVADIDGDGWADLITNSADLKAVVLLRNKGDGTFAAPVTSAVPSGCWALTAADVDGDGKVDLIAGGSLLASDPTAVAVLRNQGGGTFAAPVTYALNLSPTAITAADLNGDGKPEIIVGGGGVRSVAVLGNDGSGAFPTISQLYVFDYPSSIAVGDLDGDGRPDVVVGRQDARTGTLALLRNIGGGTLVAQNQYSVNTGASTLAAADVDGDGRVDLIVGGSNKSGVTVLRNMGNAVFSQGPTYAARNDGLVAAADLNGDGHVDIVTASSGPGAVSVLLNNGVGTFAPTARYNYVADPFTGVLADLDGDGRPDYVALSLGSASNAGWFWVFHNDGNGNFDPGVLTGAGNSPTCLTTADVNGDGKLDLIIANSGYSPYGTIIPTISVFLNTGNSTFAAPKNYNVSGLAVSVVAADYTGDGKVDIAAVYPGSTSVTLMRNNGDGTFAAAVTTSSLPNPPAAAVAADVDGDGKIDLVTVVSYSSSVSVVRNTGDGTFAPGVSYYGTTSGAGALVVADVTGDGKPDIVTGATGGVNVFRNLGNGTFAAAVFCSAPGDPKTLAAADVDGDGKIDLVAASQVDQNGSSEIDVLRNAGSGTNVSFGSFSRYEAGSYTGIVAAGDIDGDSKADVVVADQGLDTLFTWRNRGDGTFSGAVPIVAGTSSAFSMMAAGDIDGDGKTDLVTVETSSRFIFLAQNLGGRFSYTVISSLLLSYASSLNVADIDGDQKPDLITVTYNVASQDHAVVVARNLGNLTFEKWTPVYVPASDSQSVMVADVNGDNLGDILTFNPGSGTVSVLLNTGYKRFSSPVTYATSPGPVAGVVGDIDGDGLPDLIVAGSDSSTATGSISVLRNTGNGAFAAPVVYPVGRQPSAVAAIDLDGDGRLDVVSVDSQSNTLSVLRNVGGGVLAPTFKYTTEPQPLKLLTSDINGDGKPDLIVMSSKAVDIFLNNGDGTLSGRQTYGSAFPINALAVGNFDGNGGTDIAEEVSPNRVRLLLQRDVTAPVARVVATPVDASPGTFQLAWSGTDSGGSGLASYTIYVSQDGAAFKPISTLTDTLATSATYTGAAGSTYAFYATARDNAGNVEYKAAADTPILNDTTPPVATLTPLAAYSRSTSIKLSWSGSDGVGGTGVASYTVYVSDNGGAFAPVSSLTNVLTTSGTFTGAEGHSYGFYVVAIDVAGNAQVKTLADTQTFVDTISPTVVLAPLPAFSKSNTITLSWTGSDNVGGSGLASYSVYYVPKGGNSAPIPGLQNVTATSGTFTGANNTTYSFVVNATDVAGNVAVSDGKNAATVLIDNTPPTTTLAQLPAYTASANIQLSWSGADGASGSGIAGYTVFVSDNSGPFSAVPGLTDTTATNSTFRGVEGHRYGFYVIGRDNLGNVETKTRAETLTLIDTKGPTATWVTKSSTVNSTRILLEWGGSDGPNGSGIATYTVKVGLGGFAAPSLPGADKTRSTSTVFYGQNGQSYTFTVYATDNAGNAQSQSVQSIGIYVDTVPPQSSLQITSPVVAQGGPAGAATPGVPVLNDLFVNLAWSGSDAGGSYVDYTVFVSDNGGPFTAIPGLTNTSKKAYSYLATDGHTYGFYVIARDPAGNTDTKTAAEARVLIDVSPPLVTLAPVPDVFGSSNVSLAWSASDGVGGSGVATYTLFVSSNNGPLTPVPGFIGTQQLSASLTLPDGYYGFYVSATDRAGNRSLAADASAYARVDTQPPRTFIAARPSASSATDINLSWSEQDGIWGSWNATYTVHVEDNGVWNVVPGLVGTTTTGATFTGVNGHRYRFAVTGTDAAGNTTDGLPANAYTPTDAVLIDTAAPATTLSPLPTVSRSTAIALQWTADDGPDGSGVASSTVFVSDNGGPSAIAPGLDLVIGNQATFTALNGHSYVFRVLSRDNAGNALAEPPTQASTFIDAPLLGEHGDGRSTSPNFVFATAPKLKLPKPVNGQIVATSEISGQFTIKNIGGITAGRTTIPVGVYLSDDGILSGADRLYLTVPVTLTKPLKTNGMSSGVFHFFIDPWRTGNQRVLLAINDTATNERTTLDNVVTSSPMNIAPVQRNVTAVLLKTTTLTAGKLATALLTIRNTGNIYFTGTTSTLLSLAGQTNIDLATVSSSVFALRPGATTTIKLAFTPPLMLVGKVGRLTAAFNISRAVSETDYNDDTAGVPAAFR